MDCYCDNQAPAKSAGTKNVGSDHKPDVISLGRSMTGALLLQCWMVRVGVSQCLNEGRTNENGTVFLYLW